MTKLKNWFLLHFLPVWAKESVYRENQKLKQKIMEQQSEINQLKAYAAGLEYALRRRITIHNGVKQ